MSVASCCFSSSALDRWFVSRDADLRQSWKFYFRFLFKRKRHQEWSLPVIVARNLFRKGNKNSSAFYNEKLILCTSGEHLRRFPIFPRVDVVAKKCPEVIQSNPPTDETKVDLSGLCSGKPNTGFQQLSWEWNMQQESCQSRSSWAKKKKKIKKSGCCWLGKVKTLALFAFPRI